MSILRIDLQSMFLPTYHSSVGVEINEMYERYSGSISERKDALSTRHGTAAHSPCFWCLASEDLIATKVDYW